MHDGDGEVHGELEPIDVGPERPLQMQLAIVQRPVHHHPDPRGEARPEKLVRILHSVDVEGQAIDPVDDHLVARGLSEGHPCTVRGTDGHTVAPLSVSQRARRGCR